MEERYDSDIRCQETHPRREMRRLGTARADKIVLVLKLASEALPDVSDVAASEAVIVSDPES